MNNEIYFQYYQANIKKSNPLGNITLGRFLKAIKEPKPRLLELYSQIKIASLNGNLKLKGHLKEQLYSFTPAVYCIGRRRYENIDHFTGLMPLDFDKLQSTEHAEELKNSLFEYNFIVAAWLSSSGLGVRALVKIPQIDNVEDYKALFNGLASDGWATLKGFDKAPKNCVLPLFISHDPNVLYRDYSECEYWDALEYEDPIITTNKNDIVQLTTTEQDRSIKRIAGLINSALNKISDEGHLILRGISFVVGGYVGSGTINEALAVEMLHEAIDGHPYLRQKSSVYKQTALDMVKRGKSAPLTFDS